MEIAVYVVAEVDALEARATAAEAREAKLLAALEPFAEQADIYDSGCEQHSGQCPDSALAGDLPSLTVGDFRRARAAIEENQRGQG